MASGTFTSGFSVGKHSRISSTSSRGFTTERLRNQLVYEGGEDRAAAYITIDESTIKYGTITSVKVSFKGSSVNDVSGDWDTPTARFGYVDGNGSDTYKHTKSRCFGKSTAESISFDAITNPPRSNGGNYKFLIQVINEQRYTAVKSATVSDISLTIEYTPKTYTATFKNGDGSTLETVTVEHGSTPSCSKTPTKAYDNSYHYTHSGWSPALAAMTGNQTYTPTFNSIAHSYSSIASETPATCLAAGSRTKKCSCGATTTEAIAQLSHSYTGAIKNDSSSKNGTHSYKCVNGCNQYGGAKNHTWNSGVQTTAPTCTTNGVKTFTCTASGCGGTYTESIPALGHTWNDPTYTWSADGKTCTAKRVCGRCNTTETATATITSKIKTNATCTAKGTTTYTATFGVSWATTQTKDIQDIAAKGHTWVNATCTAPKTCSVCGATEGLALGHSFTNYKSDNNATCTADGTKTAKCDRCDVTNTVADVGSALGHNYVKTVVPPTETSHGYTRHTCSRCGHYYDDENSYTYLVRWYNEDGSVLLETDPSVSHGTMPNCSVIPTKQATAQYTYTHIGWAISPTAENTTGLTAVVANIDYYARFSATINKYTVTWKNDNGTVLETDTLVPYGTPPDYNGATPTKASTAQYDYTFLGWSAKIEDPPLEEGNLPTVSGNITYTAVYLPIVRKYNLDIMGNNCTFECAINGIAINGDIGGMYDYGTEFTIKAIGDFGYKVQYLMYTDESHDDELYEASGITSILSSDTVIYFLTTRLPAPIYISREQQVKNVYIVPEINTIVYVVDGSLPKLTTTMHTVNNLHFSVINVDIDYSKYANYEYHPIEQLYINDENGNPTRIW